MIIDPDKKEEISEEHKLILDQRILEYEANPDNVVDWDLIKAELTGENA
jgi:Putative addiction module component